MSIWADIHKRANGDQIKKEDMNSEESEITWYDWQEDINFTYQKLYWDRLEEERKKKEAIEIKKAEKELKFLNIWDACIGLSFLISSIFFVIALVWACFIKGCPPIWVITSLGISGGIFFLLGMLESEGIFNEKRNHVKQYLK